jgi:hypothetical protein
MQAWTFYARMGGANPEQRYLWQALQVAWWAVHADGAALIGCANFGITYEFY